MAGTSKPTIAGLGQEATYTLLGASMSNTPGGVGLFDGVNANAWNTTQVAYWSSTGAYVEIEITTNLVNIWRSGTTGWKQHAGTFLIKKWDGASYVDVTSSYPQTVTQIIETQWEKTISNLPKGKYRFEYGSGPRIDSEWYIEDTTINKYLFQDGADLKKYVTGTGWSTIGTAPATKAMFDTDGMTDLSVVDDAALQVLVSASPELLVWTDEVSASRNLNLTAVPVNKLLLPTSDVSVGEAESVKVEAVAMSGYTENLIPVMTSNTAPSGVVSASGVNSASYPAWKAFNKQIATDDSQSWLSGNTTPNWLAYEFPMPKKIEKYTISSGATSLSYLPRDFDFQGSDDNVNWTTLHSVVGAPVWTANTKREYTFKNNVAYKAYRIFIKNTTTYTTVPEMEMMEAFPGNTDIKIIVSGDSGVTYKGIGEIAVNTSDLASVKTSGYTPAQFNALTKEEISSLFPLGTARFAFYLEQEASTDTVQIDRLTINKKVYTLTPTIDSLSVLYELLEAGHPDYYVSRDDGTTWKAVKPDELTDLTDLPTGTKLRVKAILKDGQELHGLSYSWI